MDVFGTVISAGGLILRFLDACSAYSEEAKSLKVRFDWDLRVLQVLNDYFSQRRAQKADQQLPPEDSALLEQTATYLDGYVSRVQKTLRKIERNGWLADSIRRAMWIARRADLRDIEKEMFEWTRRFDVRLLGLPPELRQIIPAASDGNATKAPTVLRSNDRLREFLALEYAARQRRASDMYLKDADQLAALVTRRGDVSLQPLQYGSDQIIFASRAVPQSRIPGTQEFQQMAADMGELAAALNCLEPAADVKLLKVDYLFYHKDTHQFLFAHKSPYAASSMRTLEQMITGDPFPNAESTLNERLKLAYKISEAIFFLHTAGFVHKNITSSSVISLHPPSRVLEGTPSAVGDTYLMGYDLIRGNDAMTIQEGACRENEQATSLWSFDIFQHPDRHNSGSTPRYIKTYDLYSLGVLLLEIGFWEPLSEIAKYLPSDQPVLWANELKKIAEQLSTRTGERYQNLVMWCLSLKGDHVVQDAEFTRQVLDPLEEIVSALSHETGLHE